MKEIQKKLVSSACIKRYENNPILTDKDVPYNASLVFNAGAVKYNGRYYIVFRDDYWSKEDNRFYTSIGVAESDDGKKWSVRKDNLEFDVMKTDKNMIRVYDPRVTVIEDEIYICFAADTKYGIRGGIGKIIGDFERVEVISLTVPDDRNMVLFPEKIDGKYVRLERPFPMYEKPTVGFDIWMSKSYDLIHWGESEIVLAAEDVPFSNDKIGPAAPPIKTKYGWLTTFHSVDRDDSRGKNGWEPKWNARYCAGLMLLDLEDPSKIIGISDKPLIAPEAEYEVSGGFRNDVIFPGGMILEDDNKVKIYYGAADAVECLAEADLDELLKLVM